MKILFLAANPQSTSRLKLDTELREIEEALKLSRQSNEFELIQKWDVRPRDFRRALLESWRRQNWIGYCQPIWSRKISSY